MSKLRDSLDVLVGMEEIIVTWMPKTLVPQKMCHVGFDLIDRGELLNVLMKWKAMIHHGGDRQLIAQFHILFFLVCIDSLDSGTFTGSGKLRISRHYNVHRSVSSH